VWVDGQFRWVDDAGWQRTLDYAHDTLVTRVTLRHPDLALRLVCQDIVDFHEDLYLRQIVVHNEADREREVRLFFAQDFHISGHVVGDSAYYEPERRAVFHYKGKRWFLINTAKEKPQSAIRNPQSVGWTLGVDQWAVGIKEAHASTAPYARRAHPPSWSAPTTIGCCGPPRRKKTLPICPTRFATCTGAACLSCAPRLTTTERSLLPTTLT
jgi:GH15 family glucan-1,4-alpha-glucosidase